MPKYKVTGGDDGESGIEHDGKRYEPGATVELTAKQADWLVDIGILAPAGGKAAPAPKAAPTPKAETAKDEDE